MKTLYPCKSLYVQRTVCVFFQKRFNRPLTSEIRSTMPLWFPWIIVGGIVFIVLGWIGSRYKEREYKRLQTVQDFISGAILIGFLGVFLPDLFPDLSSMASALPDFPLSSNTVMMGGGSDALVQVGPPRLMGI